jgi:hypothetical protein
MNASQPEFDLRWFVPLFIGGWCGIFCLLSFLGGWHSLAKKYQNREKTSGKSFQFVSGGVGRGFFPVSYRSCLSVKFNAKGVALSIFPLFRICHPNLFIPWNAVADCRRERFWFINCTAIYISSPQIQIRLTGRAARELYEFRNKSLIAC